MQNKIYKLPELNFVGGITRTLRFHLKDENGEVYNAAGCNANFAVCEYADKKETPIFSVTPVFDRDEHNVQSILTVRLSSSITRSLYGTFVYQITIRDPYGEIGIPWQGIMNIIKNIDQDYISNIT